MKKVIISKYWFGYVVCSAWLYDPCIILGYESVSRGVNLFGEHLGVYERPIYKPLCFREGEALSQSFKTLQEAKNFTTLINAKEIELT